MTAHVVRALSRRADAGRELPKGTMLPLKLAMQAALGLNDNARKTSIQVSALVVDRARVPKASAGGDDAALNTVDSSRRKAYLAAGLRVRTQVLAKLVFQRPELQALGDMHDSVLLLVVGLRHLRWKVVGDIGASGGAPGPHLMGREPVPA
jgi:uncharacterized protein GlcG (DUF336 family)